jgi:hypothetical protein
VMPAIRVQGLGLGLLGLGLKFSTGASNSGDSEGDGGRCGCRGGREGSEVAALEKNTTKPKETYY